VPNTIAKLLLQNTVFVAALGALSFAHRLAIQTALRSVRVESLRDLADYAARVRYRLPPGAW
jgi:hypothetical protein